MREPQILVVDDERAIRQLLTEVLEHWGYRVATAGMTREALDLAKRQIFDVALCDIRMPEIDGIEFLRQIKRHDPSIEVVIMTAYPTVATAVEALKLGAYDYLTKPLILEELRHLMDHILERRFLRQEVHSLRSRLGEQLALNELVGDSPQMAHVKELMVKVAATDSPVLIEGESGTGKELVAAGIHRLSPRSKGPLIPVNCSAIPADLVESEFFGHVRGAFSGAVADALGFFRSADGGTIFLDEVGELPAAVQAKLLRVLQEKEIRPVGGAKTYVVDVRVVAATNREIEAAVRDGGFRQDLFYRLNVVRIVMPPLRERKEDIPPLVTHFVRQFNQRFGRQVVGIAPDAMAALVAYDFPGNVRELGNLLERAYVLGARGQLTLADLPAFAPRPAGPAAAQGLPTLAQAERELILRALQLYENDKEQTGRALGVSPRTIYRRLREYGLL